MGLLMLLGLVVMFASGPQRANVLNGAVGRNYSDTYFFTKQVVSVGIALAAFAAMACIPYEWILRHGKRLFVIGIIACLLLAFASLVHWGIAQETYGATRWFNLGPLGSLQPAEILKFGMLVFVASFLGIQMKHKAVNDSKRTLAPLAVVTGIVALLVIVIQRDLGTGISFFAIMMAMLFVSGISKKILLMILGAVMVLGILLVIMAPHRISRIQTFVQGDKTTTDDASSYHIEHAKIAIGTGGLMGVGVGNSVQATGYLPEAINDSVFAIMGETFGFVGLVIVLALFVALLMRLLKVMDHLVDQRLKLLVAGVFGWFGAHVILNVGAMTGIVPLTGITLPLLSFGGTSMLFVAAALGLVFQLSRYTVHSSEIKEVQDETTLGRRRVGRTRYASTRSY
jgi:cell division protein FtsW